MQPFVVTLRRPQLFDSLKERKLYGERQRADHQANEPDDEVHIAARGDQEEQYGDAKASANEEQTEKAQQVTLPHFEQTADQP
jgi:hypothetical protein